MKLGTKISVGFGLVVFITAAIGLFAIFNMKGIERETEVLAEGHIPGWVLAGELAGLQAQVGYALVAYGFNYDPAWLREGRAALDSLHERLERGRQAAEASPHGQALLPILRALDTDLDRYTTAIDATERNVQRRLAARASILDLGQKFADAMVAYRAVQQQSLERQIAAKDTVEELSIRHRRIDAATRILDFWDTIRVGIWSAEAARDSDAIRAAARTDELATQLDTLIGETRQEVNLRVLGGVREILVPYRAAVKELLDADTESRPIHQERRAAYETILKHIDEFVGQTAQAALSDATQTVRGIERAALVLGGLLLLALAIGIGLSIFIIRGILRQLGGDPAEVVAIVNRVAHGDLSVQVETRKGDTESLLAAFAIMVDSIHRLMREVATVSSQVAAAAEQLSSTSEETRRQVAIEQSETDQVATAINEMTATVEEVARHAAAAARAAQETDREANAGGQVVNATIAAIEALAHEVEAASQVIMRLSEDSKEIGAVLDVIRGVAEQTNLLALNAAIEAARAGEQGRGFAVVADEVRTLASRTQASIQDIQGKIERVQSSSAGAVQAMEKGQARARDGVDQARRAGESLHAITASVAAITDMNAQIASAAEEQSAVSEEINRNIHTITQTVEQTAAGSGQIATASEELARLSAQLRERIGQFQL